jgi:hypothetical protein
MIKKHCIVLFFLTLFFCFFGAFPVIAGLVNLSLNPSTIATADDVYDDCFASGAIDGPLNLKWWSANSVGTTANPHWLLIDLGSAFSIEKITLITGDTYWPSTFGNDYILYTSTTGTVWQMLGSGSLMDSPDGCCAELEAAGISARYVKYEVIGGKHWAHLGEIEIWSEQASAVPEPSELTLLFIGCLGVASFCLKSRSSMRR